MSWCAIDSSLFMPWNSGFCNARQILLSRVVLLLQCDVQSLKSCCIFMSCHAYGPLICRTILKLHDVFFDPGPCSLCFVWCRPIRLLRISLRNELKSFMIVLQLILFKTSFASLACRFHMVRTRPNVNCTANNVYVNDFTWYVQDQM